MIEVVWIVIKNKNRFLLIQRSIDDAFGGTWCLPGGKIDPGDISPIAAAARELKEETNFIGHNLKLLRTLHSKQHNIHIFLCNMWDGEFNLSCKDVEGIGWFTISEIHSMTRILAPFLLENLIYVSYLLQQY